MTSGPTMLTPSVCPSGTALATVAVPVLPLARPVLHHKGGSEPLLQPVRQNARKAVRRRRGDERHDDGDGAGGPLLRADWAPRAGEHEQEAPHPQSLPSRSPALCVHYAGRVPWLTRRRHAARMSEKPVATG